MLPKSQLQFIKSLHQKKFRKEHGLFIVEGIKSLTEFLHSDYIVHSIYCFSKVEPKIGIFPKNIKQYIISEKELTIISALKTPQGVLALVEMPPQKDVVDKNLNNNFSLVLDTIQDPGNLGTIIRTADWFGISNVICSNDTVDVFNTKVVQATMGSLAHVTISYVNLPTFLSETKLPIYAASLSGQSIYETDFGKEGLILLGNEGNGISHPLMDQAKGITIPNFGKAESLNVAISAAIFCSELKRQWTR